MEADGNNGGLMTPALLRCRRCDRSFKRSEHLKRHERIHGKELRFACSQCPKEFTRSDVLRRHEGSHVAKEQNHSLHSRSLRACLECAKARERCTKTNPCQRCSDRNLLCTFPLHSAKAKIQRFLALPDADTNVPLSSPDRTHDMHIDMADQVTEMGLSGSHSSFLTTTQPSSACYPPLAYPTEEQQIMQPGATHLSNLVSSERDFVHSMNEFPMNWLPPDESLVIDYDSISGFGMSSLDFFAFPTTSTDLLEVTCMPQENDPGIASSRQVHTLRRDHDDSSLIQGEQQQRTSWEHRTSDADNSHVASASPRSGTNSTTPSAVPGGLYTTSSNGARMPCTIRAKRHIRSMPGTTLIKPVTDPDFDVHYEHEQLSFPNLSHIPVGHALLSIGADVAHTPILTTTMYEEIRYNFNLLCLGEPGVYSEYAGAEFPDQSTLKLFIWLYFEHFNDVVPILHKHTASTNASWLLTLAICAIGCQYAEADEFCRSVEPMQEFLRRAVHAQLSSRDFHLSGKDQNDLVLAQAMTLSHVSMLYAGSARLLRLARAQHSAIVTVAKSLASAELESSAVTLGPSVDMNDDLQSKNWLDLLFNEGRRRVVYTILLLDYMAEYQFRQHSFLASHLASMPLPNDKLWMTGSAQEWCQKFDSAYLSPVLSTAVETLFREKTFITDLGQFSQVILLHGVYWEVFRIRNCFAGPLGDWIPSMQHTSNENSSARTVGPRDNGRALLNSWRNAALDCVDVLHWAANGVIAQQAGIEHATVLHLHLSRAVILAPLDQIQILAESIAAYVQGSVFKALDGSTRHTAMIAERDILEWAQRDQSKARLAVLHSGCLFWHLRRYSCRAFHEPISVFLATLTIWAYSSYASRIQRTTAHDNGHSGDESREVSRGVDEAQSPDFDSESTSVPSFIHLDRPNDDEMVQAFVRFGTSSTMRANIAGVGNIYSTKGPAKVLREGRRLLAAVSTAWGRTGRYVSTLDGLERVAAERVRLDAS